MTWNELQATRSKLGELIRSQDMAYGMQRPSMKFVGTKEGGIFKQLKSALDADIEHFSTQTGGEFKKAYGCCEYILSGKQLYKNKDLWKSPVLIRIPLLI